MAPGDECRNLRVAGRMRVRPDYKPGEIFLSLSLQVDGVRLVVNAHRAELIQDVLPEQTVKMNSEMLCQLVRFRAERCQRFRDRHAIGPPAKRNPSGGAVQTLKQFQPRPVLSNEPNGMISSSKEISFLYAIREARHS